MINDYRFWIIVAGTAALLLVGLGNRDLWNPDEPRYAQVAREMVEDGDWLVMHINGKIYPDKPPLYFWAQGLLSKITGGVDEFTARFPAAISGIAVVVVTMILAARMFGKSAALLAGLILGTSYTIVMQSRYVHVDMPLTLAMLGMFFIMYKAAFGKSPANPKLWIPFFVLGAVGVLIKGPVGLLVPLFAGFAFLVFRRVGRIERPKIWAAQLVVGAVLGMIVGGVMGMVVCLAPAVILVFATGGAGRALNRWFGRGAIVFVVILAAWLVPAGIREGWDFIYEIIVVQNFTRYTEAFSHERPFYYFFYYLPLLFIPWIAFLPQAVAAIFRKGQLDGDEAQKRLFLFAWVAATFVFFSISSSKRQLYLLPALPGLAILTARYLEGFLSRKRDTLIIPRSYRLIQVIYGFSLVLFAVALPLLPYILENVSGESAREIAEIMKIHIPLLVAASLVLALAGAFIAVNALRRRFRAAFAGMCLSTLVIIAGAEFYIMPEIADPYKSAREYAAQIVKRTGDAEVAYYGEPHEGILYYGRQRWKEIRELDELTAFMNDDSERFCLMSDIRVKFLKMQSKDFLEKNRMFRIYTGSIGSKNLVLFSNR